MPIKNWTKIKVSKHSNLATILFQLPKHDIFLECNLQFKYENFMNDW